MEKSKAMTFKERYATDDEFRERCKARSRELTAKLDSDGRKRRAEYMRNYCESHPDYREHKRQLERERYKRLKEAKDV